MSTTTTTVTTSGPLSSAAGSFITLVGKDEQAKPEKPDEKKIDKPTFVLNSSDFVTLQLYVHAGIKAPASEALFESEYPKDAFEKYLKVDTNLYEGLKAQMVLIHKHCADFQGNVVAPMITTGGLVADFGEYSKTSVADILTAVQTLIDPKVNRKDPRFEEATDTVRSACRKMIKRADQVQSNCDQLVKDLGLFRANTESDKTSLTKLNKRFHTVMPSKEEQDSDFAKLVQAAKDLYLATKKAMDDTYHELEETGKSKWYYYIPIVGAILVIWDLYKHGKLLEQAKQIQKNFEDAQAKGKEDQVKLARAYTVINHLSEDMDGILKTIDGAIASVQAMSTAFSTLSSSFTNIRSFIGDVGDDVTESSLKERGLAVTDLASATEIWERVEVLGRDFQQHGGLLAADSNNPPKAQ